MAKVLVTDTYLSNIAGAIRNKLSVQTTYTPPQMAAAIESIPTGITPTGTKNITQNGTHDVTQYASANVNVQPNLQSKTVTENGTVTPDQGYDGLSSVVVNVSGGGGMADLQNYVVISTHSGDSMERGDRKFTRDSNEPVLFLCCADVSNGDVSFSGYAAIVFTNSILSGTPQYGNARLMSGQKKTTPNGTEYYVQTVASMVVPWISENKVKFTDGSSTIEVVVDPTKIVFNTNTNELMGAVSLISEMNSLIDLIYKVFYQT